MGEFQRQCPEVQTLLFPARFSKSGLIFFNLIISTHAISKTSRKYKSFFSFLLWNIFCIFSICISHSKERDLRLPQVKMYVCVYSYVYISSCMSIIYNIYICIYYVGEFKHRTKAMANNTYYYRVTKLAWDGSPFPLTLYLECIKLRQRWGG